MEWTNRKKFLVGHLVILCILSVTFWRYFFGTVQSPETFRLIMTLAFASIVFVWMFSGFILWREKASKVIGSVAFTLPIFFQVTGWQAYLGGVLVIGLLYGSALMAEHEQKGRLKFSSIRILLVTKQMSIFAFSLALSLGYYASIRALSWDDLEPRFRLGKGAIEKILEWGGYIQPELGLLIREKKTVDEYILSLDQASPLSGDDESKQFKQLNDEVGRLRAQGINVEFSGDALSSVRGVAQNNALTAGRKQLSELAGRPVQGNEEIGVVFAEVLQTKLSTLLEGSRVQEHISDQVLPFFVTLLFFLTVWPVGLLLFLIWSVIAAIFIALLRSFGWITFVGHMTTQERLDE
ncbi:MAG: hypothetical protein KBC83_03415 [Candidatus Moranbacteria bacterium]|jgi:hypothetical protein|nr:hypothetical protein [Candidatus Moranbacteria bacterium]MBP9801685.1 hypothetical protein [Candidatus Moranbacteria bacterium]